MRVFLFLCCLLAPSILYANYTFVWKGTEYTFVPPDEWTECTGYIASDWYATLEDYNDVVAVWPGFVDYCSRKYGVDILSDNRYGDACLQTPVLVTVTEYDNETFDMIVIAVGSPSEYLGDILSNWFSSYMIFELGRDRSPSFLGKPFYGQPGALASNVTRVNSNISAASVVRNDTTSTLSESLEYAGSEDVSGTNAVNPVISAGSLGVSYTANNNSTSSESGGSVTYNNETNIEIKVDPGPADMADPTLSDEQAAERTVQEFSSGGGTEPEFTYITGTYPDYDIDWQKLQDDIKDKLKEVVDIEKVETLFDSMSGKSTPSGYSGTFTVPWNPKMSFTFQYGFSSISNHVVMRWLRTFLTFGMAFSTLMMCLKLFT